MFYYRYFLMGINDIKTKDRIELHNRFKKNELSDLEIQSEIMKNKKFYDWLLAEQQWEKIVKDITIANLRNKLYETNNSYSVVSNNIDDFLSNYDYQKWYNLIKKILEDNSPWEQLSLLWRSWTTAVYETTGNLEIIYKIATKNILQQISSLIDTNNKYNENGVENLEKEKLQKVSAFFPEGSTLIPTIHTKNIILTKEIMKQFCSEAWIHINESSLKNSYDIPITYMTKPIAEEIKIKNWISFNFDYTHGSLEKFLWKEDAISFEKDWLFPERIKEYLDKKFDFILDQIYKIEPNKDKVKELFSWIINFSKQTKEAMDIFWFDNFTFYKDKNWYLKFHVIDPVFNDQAIYDPNLHKMNSSKKIKGGKSYMEFAYPYLVEKMEKYNHQN